MHLDLSPALEDHLEAFDAAWQQPVPPRLEDFLPPPASPGYLQALRELACIDLERRLKAGQQARVEDYLTRFPELRERDALLELVLQERNLRWRLDPAFNADEYPARFPDLASEIDAWGTVVTPSSKGQAEARHAEALDLRDYVLVGLVGSGGMGEVYRGRDPALGRNLAVKVLRPELRGQAEAERRFQQEARINGVLQHPSIVPVHNLGRLPDGRLYFTMKLVRGRTLADVLVQRDGSSQPAELLGIFEKVCQAMAYAHSRGVIHRDLKPSNVMVGAFGEVQVMDWGLAKVLPRRQQTQEAGAETTMGVLFCTKPAASTGDDGAPTGVVGTPAYMAPEQARGGVDVDERADVFGLGGILCVILSGKPPFTGHSRDEVLGKATAGDVAEAMARVEGCCTDAELVCLCRDCLAARREDRPANAREVARRMAAYQARVQERLRQAEIARAAAAAREQEARATAAAERKARRRTRALAFAVVLVVLAGGAAAWQVKQRQTRLAEAESALDAAAAQCRLLLTEGWEQHDQTKLAAAMVGSTRTMDIGRAGTLGDDVQERARALHDEVAERLSRWQRNRKLLDALLDVAGPQQEKRGYTTDGSGVMAAEDRKSIEAQYADAFRDWGLDVDQVEEKEVVARFKEEPAPVVQEVIAGLDAWMMERLNQRLEGGILTKWVRGVPIRSIDLRKEKLTPKQKDQLENGWRRLFRLAQQLDESAQRRALRDLIVQRLRLRAQARDDARRRLQALRGGISLATAPVLTVVLLAQATNSLESTTKAEEVLRQALAARPDQVVLLDALGKLLEQQDRMEQAIGCYQAIRARIPLLGMPLGVALVAAGRPGEAEAVFRDLVRLQPTNPDRYTCLGYALEAQKKTAEAVVAYKEAVRLKPDYHGAHYNLGNALMAAGKLSEAEGAYREAIRLKPDFGEGHCNLGHCLRDQGRLTDALEALRHGHALGSKNFDWPCPSPDWVRQCERLVDLDRRLPALLAGDAEPVNATEQIEFAVLCALPCRRLHATAARLYADAFAARMLPDGELLGINPEQQHRYKAARSAALAAAGQAEDARELPDKVIAMLRRQALRWLTDELAYSRRMGRPVVARRLTPWLKDAGLASVREPEALDRLPPDERQAWRRLWKDVEILCNMQTEIDV
jgi:serine/threonine-protein kinase